MSTDGRALEQDPRIGTTLGGYRIDGIAGRGGMGVVYRAWDPSLDRPVAIKVLPAALGDDDAFRQRFLRETRLAAAIDHPNIIPIYEAGDDGGVLFLAMRLVDGVDLDRRLADGPLDVAETVALIGPVAAALDDAHAGGLVHRDVKPANILIGRSATGASSVYLTDFGLTKQRASQSGLTKMGNLLGTVEYMAPEQIEGHPVDGAADQYALAGTLFRCLTGHVPFERDSPIATAMAHLKEPPPRVSTLRPDIPPAVDGVIARGMAKVPAERFATCRELVAALERAGAPPAALVDSRPRPVRVAMAGIVVVIVLAVAGGLALGQGRTPATPAPTVAIVPSATPALTATPPSTAFPTTAEQKLLETLPASLRATCIRGQGGVDLKRAGFTGQEEMPAPIVASLACTPTAGPTTAWFLWYDPTVGADARSTADLAVGQIGARFHVPDGDCAKPPARGSWRTSTGGSGNVACIMDVGTGHQSWIYWTFATSHVFGMAVAPAGDYSKLYGWWQGLTPFLP